MATYASFEDLPVWQHAVELYVEVFKLCERTKLRTDFKMRDQVRDAASSISNNIAEGFEYNSNKSFYNYLRIAKGSAGETRNQLILSYKVGMIEKSDYEILYPKLKYISQEISNFMDYLSANPRGRKFENKIDQKQ